LAVFCINVFGKDGCAKCKATQQKLAYMLAKWSAADKVVLAWFDMDTEDGMAEGAYRDVGQVPTTLLLDAAGGEVARYEAEIPPSEKIKQHLMDAGVVQA
jgi:hypothetical protein